MKERFAEAVTRHPWWVLGSLLAATLWLGLQASQGLSLRVLLEEMLPADRHNVQLVQKFGAQFGGANTTLIAVRNTKGDIYDTEFLQRYAVIAEEIYYHPDAIRHLVQALSLRKTKSVSGGGGRVEISAVMWPAIPQDTEELARLRQDVKEQFQGFLVSDAEDAVMIVADFKDGTDYEALVAFIDTLRASNDEHGIEIHAAGRPLLLGLIYQALDDVVLIFALSLLAIVALLFLYFRAVVGVLVPVVAASMVTSWGLGVMGVVEYNLDPLLVLLPAFVFAIVLSHSVQFVSRVLEQLQANPNMRRASKKALARLLLPSGAAVVTDAAGFTVLLLVGIPSIQALALICTLWLLAIFPALVLVAALVAVLPRPGSYRLGLRFIERAWRALNLEKHGALAISLFLCAFVAGVYGTGKLMIGDEVGSSILWPESRFNSDSEYLNDAFTLIGTDVLQVYIEGEENTMVTPSVFHSVEALDRYVYQYVEEARPAQSLVPVVKTINRVLYEGDPSYAIVPDTVQEVAFNTYLFRSKGEPGDFAAYTDPEWRVGNLSIPMKNHAADTVERAIAALDDFVANGGTDQLDGAELLFAGGQIGIAKAINDEIREANLALFSAIILVIAACVFAYYRSLVVSALLVFALATSNFVTYAFMAANGIGLNLNTLILSALGIGLGVDYGIYMFDRIREESRAGFAPLEAVVRSISTAGNAIFVTAFTMIIPMLPWLLLSSLRFQAEMGLLLGMVLFLNMIGALVFLPSGVLIFKPKALVSEAYGESSGETRPVNHPGEQAGLTS